MWGWGKVASACEPDPISEQTEPKLQKDRTLRSISPSVWVWLRKCIKEKIAAHPLVFAKVIPALAVLLLGEGILSSCANNIEGSAGRSTERLVSSIKETLTKEYKELDLDIPSESVMVTVADLNLDGYPDGIAQVVNKFACGSLGCDTRFFLQRADGSLNEMPQGYVLREGSITVLPQVCNHFRTLEIVGPQGDRHLWCWNGSSY
jgi:hypothetical protein